MAKPKLFIGSSKANIAVARLVANRLEADGSADVTVWDEGVFSLNKGFLEKLLAVLSEFDFAVLIWRPTMSQRARASQGRLQEIM